MISFISFKSGNSLLRVTGYVVCLFAFIVLFVQCKPGTVIDSREDFHLLDDIKKLEYEYSLHEGIKHKLLGEFEKSEHFFQNCIHIFPYSDVSYFELSNLYYMAGEFNQSIFYARKALEIDDRNLWYYKHLAALYREHDRLDSAIIVYENAVSYFPDNIDIYFALGAYYGAGKRYPEAVNIYNAIEEFTGVNERTSLNKQQVYMEMGEYEKAYGEIKKLISLYPDEPDYYGVLAELYSSIGMDSAALESYRELFKIDPENGSAQLSIAEFLILREKEEEAFIYLINAIQNNRIEFNEKAQFISGLMQDGNIVRNYYGNLEQLGLLLTEEYPNNNLARGLLAEFYINNGKYANAEDLLFELHRSEPGNKVYAEQIMAVLSYKEEYEEVIEKGKYFTEMFSDNLLINYLLGIAYHLNDSTDKAIEAFNVALDNEELYSEIQGQIYTYLGDVYFKKEDYSLSDKYFELSLEIDSNNLIALNNYAYYLSLRGLELEKAREFSLRTIEQQPNNASFLDTYAWILYKLEDYEESLIYIERAYKMGGKNSLDVMKHYGEILIKNNNYSKAREILLRAREHAEEPEMIDKLLEIIED